MPAVDNIVFEIPEEFSLTTTGDRFLQVDSNMGGRFLLFGSELSIQFLRNSPHWYMDGTFDSVPPQFMQLYTIHGLNDGRNCVGLYALLKSENL